MMCLQENGYLVRASRLPAGMLWELREMIFTPGSAGTRCLLDDPGVRAAAVALRRELVAAGLLGTSATAVQAIAFDKTAGTNWKVSWHQDLMFPFAAAPPAAAGYGAAVRKDGVNYSRPPTAVLEELLAVRLHLDDCGPENGPLRVIPGSHRHGVLPSEAIPAVAAAADERQCEAREGELLIMRPLLLHASSRAEKPGHRRVLHLVYHSGRPLAAAVWHRSV
jgi:ectoine hydroxylase-related dioxygenase (phytanoyl-CoA dioxygenase family)